MDTSTSGLDVKGGDQADDGLQQDRYSAEEDGNPSRIHRQILPQKMLHRRDTPPRTRKVMSFLVPPPLQKRF